jgi:hypothetical protein
MNSVRHLAVGIQSKTVTAPVAFVSSDRNSGDHRANETRPGRSKAPRDHMVKPSLNLDSQLSGHTAKNSTKVQISQNRRSALGFFPVLVFF